MHREYLVWLDVPALVDFPTPAVDAEINKYVGFDGTRSISTPQSNRRDNEGLVETGQHLEHLR